MNYQEQRKLAAKIVPDESDFIMDDGNCFDKIVARVAESGRLADRLSRLRQLVNDARLRLSGRLVRCAGRQWSG